jgi:hypothetical protein
MVKPEWRNRIISSGEEAPDQLLANPFNARIHPKPQQDALSGVLNSVGWIAPVIVNQRTGHVIDGHLRVSLALSKGEKTIPVDYVDLDENEEKILLATFDYITGMAVYDREAVDTLLSEINAGDAGLEALLEAIDIKHGALQEAALSGVDGERGQTPDERLDIFMNASIKQIVLYFQLDEYTDIVQRLARVRHDTGVESNTEAVVKLLEAYENT